MKKFKKNKIYIYGYSGLLCSKDHIFIRSLYNKEVNFCMYGEGNQKNFFSRKTQKIENISKSKFWFFMPEPFNDESLFLEDIINNETIPIMPKFIFKNIKLFNYKTDVLEYSLNFYEKIIEIGEQEYYERLENLKYIYKNEIDKSIFKKKASNIGLKNPF